VINKQTGTTPVTISLSNFASGATAEAWQISSTTQTSINHLAAFAVVNNAIATTVPSQSITLFVVPAGSAAPAAPVGLTAATKKSAIHLSWTASPGAVSYTIYRGTAPGAESATPLRTGLAATSFIDATVAPRTRYYYQVVAVTAAGRSALSNESSAEVIIQPDSSRPHLLSPPVL
jgi:fibronectin type 3 domain-containing protein